MSKPKESPEKCSQHLLYEIEMFYSLGKRLITEQERDWVLDNALLEAFLVHTRLLCDFFCEKPKEDDIGIKKHFDLARIQSSSNYKTELKIKINKRVAHLTETRVNVNASDEGWRIGEILRTIGTWIKQFSSDVDPKKVCDDFKFRVEQCIEDYRKLENAHPPISRESWSTSDQRPPAVIEMKANPTPRQDE